MTWTPSNDNAQAQPSEVLLAALLAAQARVDCAHAELEELRRELSKLRIDHPKLASAATKPIPNWDLWALVAMGGTAALLGGLLAELPALLRALHMACQCPDREIASHC